MPIYNAALTHIDQREIKRYAGLSKTSFDESTIKAAAIEIQSLAKVQGTWEIYNYQSCLGEIKASSPAYIEGEKIRTFLRSAEKLIFLACTIGEEVEAAITQHFQEGHYADALLLDAAATTALEGAADTMGKSIQQTFNAKGYQTLSRFSPGYGDWDIHFQPKMLALAHADKINIHLTEAYMLIPRKSITAVIGLTPAQLSTTKEITCKNCNKNNCLARKEITS